MVEVELYSYLSTTTAITDLVQDRIYPITAPENCQTPYITYMNVSDKDLTSLGGHNYANKTRFQIDVFSESYKESKEIKGAVKTAMYQFKYLPFDFSSRDVPEKDTQLYRQLIEFILNT